MLSSSQPVGFAHSGPMPLRLTVDRFGRVVIPKALRDRYGWAAGSDIEVREEEDSLRLLPSARQVLPRGLTVRSGRVVYEAPWPDARLQTLPERIFVEQVRRQRALRVGTWA